MSFKIPALNGGEYEEIIVKGKKKAVVFFLSEWSEPCRLMYVTMEMLAENYSGTLPFYFMDPDNDPLVAASSSIFSIPTTVFYKDGVEIGRTVGIREYEYIANIIDKNMI